VVAQRLRTYSRSGTAPLAETRLLIRGEHVRGEGDALEVENPFIFAPAVITVDEAIELATASRFGLGRTVYTRDLEAILRCMREIRAGTIWFNDPLTENDAGPFACMKQSGLGRELGPEGLEAFQETKHVHLETRIEPQSWSYPYGGGAPT
jgi:acyl-CoA reductase-like NAD-dependent aldehyde dehydrogenase